MKVLLVDDEEAIVQVFTTALQTGGIDVVSATTGNEGIQKAQTEKPDVILLDQVLPDINGNQVLENLKNNELTKNIPVAILSNFSQDGLVQEAMKLGASEYILKYQIAATDLPNKVQQLAIRKEPTLPEEANPEVV
ncbi:MAG: response regulator [Candidatus Levyibacteriota bacterium]